MKLTESQVQQVCFIRLGAVGDLLVSTAALEETLQRFPNAKVWVAGSELWKQLLIPSRWPRINGIITLDKKGGGVLSKPNLQTEGWDLLGEPQSIRQFLKQCQASVNLRPESLRYAWPAFFAGVKFRLGSCWWGVKWLYNYWSPWLGKDPIIHERDRLLRIACAPRRQWWPLGFTSDNKRDLIWEQTHQTRTRKADKYLAIQPGQFQETVIYRWRDKVLPKLKNHDNQAALQITHTAKYILVNPSASRIEKAWPAPKFRELCLRLSPWLQKRGYQLLVIGAPLETDWLKQVAGNELPFVQPKNLRLLMDVIAGAGAVITNTSSLQFFANSMGTPTLTLMGRTFPARWGPLAAQDLTICGKLPSPPMHDVFAEDYAAYNSITVETVETQFKEWFSKLQHQLQ